MRLDKLIEATGSPMSLLPKVREMTPFGRGEPASQVPEERWFLFNGQKSFYSSGFRVWGSGVSFEPHSHLLAWHCINGLHDTPAVKVQPPPPNFLPSSRSLLLPSSRTPLLDSPTCVSSRTVPLYHLQTVAQQTPPQPP